MSKTVKVITVEKDVLRKNNEIAASNQAMFARAGVTVINLLSSPGSGKTSLLEYLVPRLMRRFPVYVIEGDVDTPRDAERIMATGAQVVQVTTKGGCHLNANMVEKAWHDLVTQDKTAGLLFVENVGNLVCPASFDLGETMKGVVLSVTEGEDKPIKYPKAFRLARFCVINKTDLLPHLDFDLDQCRHYIRQVNPSIDIFEVSAKTSAGLDSLQDYFTALVP